MILTRRAVALTLSGVCAFVLLYPFETTVTGVWVITATNAVGQPLAGCQVEQLWEWRAVGVAERAVLTTDVAGHAIFPRRSVHVNVIRRVAGSVATLGFHTAPAGRAAHFIACDAKNQPAELGIHQWGDTLMYTHHVATEWRDASMLR